MIIADISLFQAIWIGILEGLTEFLPVSSSAHMEIVPQMLGQAAPSSAFEAVIQLGPIIAIVAYFRKDVLSAIQGVLRTKNPFKIPADDFSAKLGWYSLLATPPILFCGKLLEHQIDSVFRRPYVIAAAAILFGIVLFIAEKMAKQSKSLEAMTLADSQIIGWGQVLALIPGVSRSGATIAAALFRGIDRESAARFSFLLSIPAISAAGLYKLYKDVIKVGVGSNGPSFLVGTVVAGVTAYLVIEWFLGYIRKQNMNIFIIYRILFGIAIILLVQAGIIRS